MAGYLIWCYFTGLVIVGWFMWFGDMGSPRLWQRAIEAALWPIALPYATVQKWRGR